MTITALPTPPTRSDPTNFASRADAFLAALPTFADEANALAAAMNLNATQDTSATSNSIGTGAKTFTVSTGKSFFGGMYILIADTAAPTTNAMIAQVTSYSGSTLVVNVKYIIGSGTKTAWLISQSVPYVEHIDGVPVGATTPATGAFTTLSASGAATLQNNVYLGAGTVADGALIFRRASDGATVGTHVVDIANSQMKLTSGYDKFDFYGSAASFGTWTPTGLSVTGALSATGALNFSASGSSPASGYGVYQKSGTGTVIVSSYKTVISSDGGVTDHVTLDTSGNLGLGVTPVAGGGILQLPAGNGVTCQGDNTNFTSNAKYVSGWKRIQAGITPVRYEQVNGASTWYNAATGAADSVINWTQAMTLDVNGFLIVGRTSYASGSASSGTFKSAGTTLYGVTIANSSATDTVFLNFLNNSDTSIGSVTQSGSAVVYNTTSDHRLKLNVRDANAARFMDIQFRDFEWVDGRHDCGVIAHELQAVYPDLVLGEKDATEVRTVEITPAVPEVKDEEGNVVTPAVPAVTEQQTFPVYQQVNYIGLIGRMGTRIQQQQRTVDAQAAALAALEARLTAAGI